MQAALVLAILSEQRVAVCFLAFRRVGRMMGGGCRGRAGAGSEGRRLLCNWRTR